MLEGLLKHKKEEKEYYCALTVSLDRIEAALWEGAKDQKAHILKTVSQAVDADPGLISENGKAWKSVIDASDRALTELETHLPQGAELKRIVFGLHSSWLENDKIIDTHLAQLKQLTSALSLTPLGFVELPVAIVHLMEQNEGTPQTLILVAILQKEITVSVFKIGKLIGSKTVERTENTPLDIERALTAFTDLEVLPSRMLLYGTVPDLEKQKTELMNYPWQKKANFLHFPKIDLLEPDFAVRSVAVSSASEIVSQGSVKEEAVPENTQATKLETSPHQEAVNDEINAVAADLGFVADNEVEEEEYAVTPQPEEKVYESESPIHTPRNIPVTLEEGDVTARRRPFSLPSFTFSFRIPRLPKLGLIVATVIVLMLVLAGVAVANWYVPQVKVIVLVKPQKLNLNETVYVTETEAARSEEGKSIVGRRLQTEVENTRAILTTGKKTVGEKAKGEVTIYNKTLNSKTFKQATIILSGKYKFSLDDEVQVASASDTIDSRVYGRAKASVTATNIGTEYNLPSGTDFSFEDLPTSSYSARTEKAMDGGTSREVAVVSRDDQNRAKEEITAELTELGLSNLRTQITDGDQIIESSVVKEVKRAVFDKEIGEEADEVKIDTALQVSALVYHKNDLDQALEGVITASLPENFIFNKEDVEYDLEELESEETVKKFKVRITANLLPNVETKDLAQKLVGKTSSDATNYLRSISGISGIEIVFTRRLPFFNGNLPRNPANITLTVSSLN
ncbi:hypothetical protein HY408_01250 [Candidatus Gottesmanbacteria bacterium]|nr:hypothetical protein [Candidatus Gottesmanbacteria bacterium]